MIKLRKLENKDVEFMLEWMHDPESKEIFQAPFSKMTAEDVLSFIASSFTGENQHFAVVDDKNDEYLGTISLKNIDLKNENAEYAISMRKKARGTGASKRATMLLLEYAFCTLSLSRVYLCVLDSNKRAGRFYEKCGFKHEGIFRKHIKTINGLHDLLWLGIMKDEYNGSED